MKLTKWQWARLFAAPIGMPFLGLTIDFIVADVNSEPGPGGGFYLGLICGVWIVGHTIINGIKAKYAAQSNVNASVDAPTGP